MKPLEYPTVRWARELPSHPAILEKGRGLSYAELERMVREVATALRERGMVAADRVIVCAANSVEWIVMAHAVARLGAVLVPATARLTAEDARLWLQSYQPRMVIVDADRMAKWTECSNVCPIKSIEARQPADDIPDKIDPETLHTIISTSGSEGEPKGVCLSFRNHLSNALGSALNLGVRPGDRWLLNLPLYHVGGFAISMRAAVYGTTVLVHDRFDPEATLRAIHDEHVTQLSLVATTLKRLLDRNGDRSFPPHLRSVLVGGGPIPSELIEHARSLGLPVLPTYGMTETASQIATLSAAATGSKRFTAGRPLALAEIEIRDDASSPVPPNVEGRIRVRGPMVALGYWQTEEKVLPVVDRDGWYATNDIGSLDEDAYLTVHGRLDNVIISGGEKIHAEEIENALLQIAGVSRAVVIPAEHAEWGQEPVAYVESSSTTSEYVQQELKRRIAGYKCPRRIEVLDQIPTLPSGKADRAKLTAFTAAQTR